MKGSFIFIFIWADWFGDNRKMENADISNLFVRLGKYRKEKKNFKN